MLISSALTAQNELNSYLETAAQNNPGLKTRFNEYMAALEKAPQVKALPDPQIAFAYFISPVETRVGPQQFKISASQMFPWFGTLKSAENASIQNAKAKFELFEEAKAELFNNVKNNYFDLYFNKKAIGISLENLDILASFKKLALIKVEAGLVSAVDDYRIEMEIYDLENSLALLRDKQSVLRTAFNNLLNTNDNAEVIIPNDLWTDDIAYAKTAALDSIRALNHQLLNIDFQQQALVYKKEWASKKGNPSFKIGMDYTFVGKGGNNLSGKDAFIFPSIGITLPLYRSKYKAMVNEVVYLESAKAEEKVNKLNVLETVFEEVWKDYRDANRRIDLYNRQLELAKISLKLLETDYATGNRNFEEILRMDRKVLKYNLELERAKADKQASISFITYLMGK
jgi:outer membrane protein TolC